VVRRDDDPHAADSEDALDAVFAGKDIALANSRRRVRPVFHHARAP
jgi:hypothetical protein